jgi:diguanylate cyclase (GGDEF)-like protein
MPLPQKLTDFFKAPDLTEQGARELFRLLTWENLTQVCLLTWVSILIMTFLAGAGCFVVFVLAIDQGKDLTLTTLPLRIAWVAGALLFLWLVKGPVSSREVRPFHHMACLCMAALAQILGAVQAGVSFESGPGLSVYVMTVMVVAAFLKVRFPQSLAVYLPGCLTLILIVRFQGRTGVHIQADLINAILTAFLGALLSQLIYIRKVREYLDLGMIQKQREKFRRLSFIDPLTGIPNRRFLDQALSDEWRRAYRNQGVLSAIMIDVDYFKKFNDTYGHLEGDQCLIKVARALEDCLGRSGDTLARYGGEEFAALLPETPALGASEVAEKMRRAVESLGIENKGAPQGRLTISLGVCCQNPAKKKGPSALIKSADQALYTAKREGRNRHVLAD